MPKFKLAHIHEQGQNMLIFPLDARFGNLSNDEQSSTLAQLEMRAHAAGLAGTAVAVWQQGHNFHFIGPRPWHPFLRSINMLWVQQNVNRELTWQDS